MKCPQHPDQTILAGARCPQCERERARKCPKCGSEMEATTVCDLDTDKYVPVWLCHDSECDFCTIRGHEEKVGRKP
jgi:hypothetical protein